MQKIKGLNRMKNEKRENDSERLYINKNIAIKYKRWNYKLKDWKMPESVKIKERVGKQIQFSILNESHKEK